MKLLRTTLPSFALALVLPVAALLAQSSTQNAPMDDSMHMNKPPVPPSHSLNVGFGGHVVRLTTEDLLKMPQTTVHVHNMHTSADETYSGPLLSEVLGRAGLAFSKDTEATILHSAVIATGTDRYYALFSAAELMPQFSRSQAIVAVMKNGLPDTTGGLIQVINTDGARPSRWVHGLQDLNVITLQAKFTPPASAPEAAPPQAH